MPQRVQPHLAFAPTWEGAIQQWACKCIRNNRWRCDRIHEFEDLLQDAHMLFEKLAAKYPRINAPQKFMAIFKAAMNNAFHDHARYQRRKRDYEMSEEGIEFSRRILGEVSNNGYLNALIAEGSDNVQHALAAFDDPITLAAMRLPRRKQGKLRAHENLNRKLCRVTGAPEGCDLVRGIKRLLAK
jgi:DNA-directed RNA polymerase specialized sigma24 family protein